MEIKEYWSSAEDAKLHELVGIQGTTHWNCISEQLPPRTGKQCRERWFKYLKPGIKNNDWTPEEDQAILTIHKILGNSWSKVCDRYAFLFITSYFLVYYYLVYTIP